METSTYQKNYDLERQFWWFVGMRRIYRVILDSIFPGPEKNVNILDIGCGVGNNLAELSRYGKVIGIDDSKLALDFCKKSGFNTQVQANACCLPFKNDSFFLVAVLNVIEHITNDELLIKEASRVCQRGGRVLVVTSAFSFLWSGHDEAAHHYRRYSKRTLWQKIEDNGLYLERISYANWVTFHFLALLRPIQRIFKKKTGQPPKDDLQELPFFINWVLTKILFLESIFLKKYNLPYGVSLLCLAKKV